MRTPALAQSLRMLLQIEDDNELIGLTCPATRLPVWPIIRVPVLRTIMSDWLYKSEPLSSLGSSVAFIDLAKKAAISLIHNFSYKENTQRNILIQSSGLGNYYHDRLIYDRLTGYFATALPNRTLVYQDKPKNSFLDEYSFNPILHKIPRNIINKLYSKLAVNDNHRQLANCVVNRAAENASSRLGYEFSSARILGLVNSLAAHLALLPYASDAYANWFSKQGFRLLLKEDACYGGGSISIIHAAKLCGMVVAEYQHGAILKGHDGYNVADALANSHSFKAVLPDYLLTYGNWWSNQTNMPIQKIAIGNPHLTEALKARCSDFSKRNQVLILGDGIETKLYLNLADHVFDMVKGQGTQVVFRPHPFEREKVKSLTLPNGVRLDSNEDIYSSLKESNVVISELSTGLFEAVGLVDKVLLWETDKSRFLFPEIPFTSFSKMVELESILSDKDSFQKVIRTIPTNDLWQPNWKQNYLNFIEGVIG